MACALFEPNIMIAQDDDLFVAKPALYAYEWRGVNLLAQALDEFQPWPGLELGTGRPKRLVRLGLAEEGWSQQDLSGAVVGYRLTELGWRIKIRGPLPLIRIHTRKRKQGRHHR